MKNKTAFAEKIINADLEEVSELTKAQKSKATRYKLAAPFGGHNDFYVVAIKKGFEVYLSDGSLDGELLYRQKEVFETIHEALLFATAYWLSQDLLHSC